MKPVSLTVVVACALFASWSSRMASSNTSIELTPAKHPTPSFERFSPLTASKFQLVLSFEFSKWPEEVRFVRSPPLSVVDSVNGQFNMKPSGNLTDYKASGALSYRFGPLFPILGKMDHNNRFRRNISAFSHTGERL